MKYLIRIMAVFGLVLLLGFFLNSSELNAQNKGTKTGRGFIDLNNDGINDNALDFDHDGVPNCIDPDFAKVQNRRLIQNSFSYRNNYKFNNAQGNGYGPGKGLGNNGVGPRDCTGYGPGSGTGICDGTGPKGKRGGRR